MNANESPRVGNLTGLDPAEAARRLLNEGPNILPGSASRSMFAMAAGVLLEPMFRMLLSAGGLYLAPGDRASAYPSYET